MFHRKKKNARPVVEEIQLPDIEEFHLKETEDTFVSDEELKASLPPDVAVYYEDDVFAQPFLPLSPVALDKPVFSGPLTASFLEPYIDELSLFEKRWGYDKGPASREEWCLWAKEEIVPVFKKLLDFTEKESVFLLQSAVVYLEADCIGETLRFFKNNDSEPFWTKTFERLPNGRCVTDFFKRSDEKEKDVVALVVVTAGKKVQDIAKKWKLGGHETDFRYLNGLGREAVSAMTAYTVKNIVEHGACVGKTVTFPENEAQKVLMPLIDVSQAEKIGVSFSKTGTLVPMYSAVSFVCPR